MVWKNGLKRGNSIISGKTFVSYSRFWVHTNLHKGRLSLGAHQWINFNHIISMNYCSCISEIYCQVSIANFLLCLHHLVDAKYSYVYE